MGLISGRGVRYFIANPDWVCRIQSDGMGILREISEYVDELERRQFKRALLKRGIKNEGGKGMDFAYALNALKEGQKVERSGWNGKGMFIFYNPGSTIKVTEGRPLASALPVGTECTMLPYIMMKTAQGDFVPWLASQTDILAEDWRIV